MSAPLPQDGPIAGDAGAWREIQALVDEIADLAERETSAERFHDETLRRLLDVTSAEAGCTWVPRDGRFSIDRQVTRNGAADGVRDAIVPAGVVESRRAVRLEPESNGRGGEAAVRTLCPVFAGGEAVAVLELRQAANTPPAARRASLQLLEAVAELAGDFHRNRLLGEFRERERDWDAQRAFTQRVHLGRSRRETAVAIANEGRAYVRCARFNVFERRGGTWRVVAVSGATHVESRSDVVRRMEALANLVLPAESEFVHVDGERPVEPLAPQVEDVLNAYLEVSPARLVFLHTLPNGVDEPTRPEAAVLAEHFDLVEADGIVARTRRIATDAGQSFATARRPSALSRLPRRVLFWAVPAMLLFAALLLTLVPAEFSVPARGTIEPSVHRRVFAPRAGRVRDLQVTYGQDVDERQALLELEDPDLALQRKTLAGEIQTASLQLTAAELSQFPGGGGRDRENPSGDPAARVKELRELQTNLLERQRILDDEWATLDVTSPVRGRVVTWDLERRLDGRPVQRGDLLLEVSRFDGPWRLRLDVPDDEFGHVRAARTEGDALRVEYALATEPERMHEAWIDDVALTTELDAKGESVVRAEVVLARDEVPVARPGATVVARIHCGSRSLGYVWFHEAIHAIRTWWYR